MIPNQTSVFASNGHPSPSPRPARSRAWIWFFVVLIVLTVAATAFLWMYNLQQQLSPEKLALAKKLWHEKKPRSYLLTYTKEGDASGTFIVRVRNGRVELVVMKQEVEKDGQVNSISRELPERLRRRHDMAGLFKDLEDFLAQREKGDEKGRIFLRAYFDPNDGHVNQFTYSNSATGRAVKVVVDLQPLGPDSRG